MELDERLSDLTRSNECFYSEDMYLCAVAVEIYTVVIKHMAEEC